MKDGIIGLLFIFLLYVLPAGVVLKYGDRYESMFAFIPVFNVIISTVIAGETTWKYIHER